MDTPNAARGTRAGGQPNASDDPAHGADSAGSAGSPVVATVTAVADFSRAGGREAFRDWAERVHRAAAEAPGFVSQRLGVIDSDDFDWSLAVTFDDVEHLDGWLDGPRRQALLAEGARAGFQRLHPDLVVVDGQSSGTGVEVFRHAVAPGKEDEFIAAEQRIIAASRSFSGYEGVSVLPPEKPDGEWLSLLRFRTDRQLSAWLDSPERLAVLPTLRSQLTRDFSVITRRTAYGSILRVEDGQTRVTPNWKSAMLVLLVLYPTVMTLSRFLGPVLDGLGAEPWLSMWLSQIVSVALMTFLFMPLVTGLFRRWLDPVQGSSMRVTLIGVLIIIVVYVSTLALFANVTWLQFWQHPS